MNAAGARKNLNVAAIAVMLGVAGDMLLGRATGIGVNVALWTTALVCAAVMLDRGGAAAVAAARETWRG